jgi:hypothetical protein
MHDDDAHDDFVHDDVVDDDCLCILAMVILSDAGRWQDVQGLGSWW